MNNDEKKSVIFICVHNSARSQMAEAFLKKYGPELFDRIESAGIEGGTLNPIVVEAMAEKGIDISANRTKSAMEFVRSGTHFDYVVTVCDAASAERCPIFPGINVRLRWSFPDPSEFKGTHEEKLVLVRNVRDDMEETIVNWAKSIHANGYPR